VDKLNPMSILVVEDDAIEARVYADIAERRYEDVKLVAITNSSSTAIEHVKASLPEGIILDLQLISGEGSGLQFLETLVNDMTLPFLPLIVVTTSNNSKAVHLRLEQLGVDWFFYKTARDYSHELVISTLVSLRGTLALKQKSSRTPAEELEHIRLSLLEAPANRADRIYQRVDIELNNVGIRSKLKGRQYLRDAIFFQITQPSERGSGIELVAVKTGLTYSSLVKSMQTAINDAWTNADPEMLIKNFTSRIAAKNGSPYVSDFIHYFADKISKSI